MTALCNDRPAGPRSLSQLISYRVRLRPGPRIMCLIDARSPPRASWDEDLITQRLKQLHATTKQLRTRHDELTLALDDEPATPAPTTLHTVADHITEIITNGNNNQTKALIEALVATVTITAPDRLTPIFRIPQPPTTTGPHPPNQRKRPRRQRFAQ